MKFGGTSVQDTPSMLNVAEIVKEHLHLNPFVVISAIAQGTNMLTTIGKEAESGNKILYQKNIETFIGRHHEIVENGVQVNETKERLFERISKVEKELLRLSEGIYLLKECSPRSLDALCVNGEYLSSLCISEIFREQGIDNVWIDARAFIVTDSNFTAASPQMKKVKERFSSILNEKKYEGKVFITQGFIGATENGVPTTMGRESSDFSAAVIGEAINASEIQIWTDVDGIFTADPRVISQAKHIAELTFEEALELADKGAKVLHPKTMLPAMERNIPIRIRNSKNKKSSGSLITSEIKQQNGAVSIAQKKDVILIRFSPFDKKNYPLLSEHISGLHAKYCISPLSQISDERGITFLFQHIPSVDFFIREISEIGQTEIQTNLSLISLVGRNIFRDEKVMSIFANAAYRNNIKFLFNGASQKSIGVVIDEYIATEFLKELHQSLFV